MGYQRKELQILGGGFNLLPSVDKTPMTDYLLAQNWRMDRDGRLVSRWGYRNYASYSGAGKLHSAAVFNTNVYWGSDSGKLFFGGVGSAVATGFDGGRLGMAGQLGWMWIINRAKQGRHNVTNGFQNYGLTAPAGAATAAAGAAGGPNGTYSVWVTFVYYDSVTGLLTESNPSPAVNVTVTNQNINLTGIPTSADSRVNGRNIYLSGGTLGSAYLAIPYAVSYASIEDNATTTATITLTDLAITNEGIFMPTTNDLPPAASGVVGPYFDRLLAFSTAGNVNRLFWTEPGKPQYWPGAADSAIGNWVDVGQDGEAILWVTLHTNIAIIYKQRTIWRLVGDLTTGTLEQVDAGMGLTNAFAVAPAGHRDYFVGPNGLYTCNGDAIQEAGQSIRPLFQTVAQNTFVDQPPGNVTNQVVTGPITSYKCALGYGMGKLYLSYTENSGGGYPAPMLVLHEQTGRWAYYRSTALASQAGGFVFDGSAMVAMGSDGSGNGYAANVDDFAVCATTDAGSVIDLEYGSHYEDCGLPDNQKNWLEVVVDCEVTTGDTLSAYASFDSGTASAGLLHGGGASPNYLPLGTIAGLAGGQRQQVSFPVGPLIAPAYTQIAPDGYLAKNMAVRLSCGAASHQVVIHNVYLYYYVEARLAAAASTLPTDLGVGKVKQCKELELDIDSSSGAVACNIYSDLPGNALAVRQTPAIAQGSGRAVMKFPFAVTEGFLWRVALTAAAATQPFRLYAARLLMRVVGVYVEAYEAAAGFAWDSMEMTFDSGITHIPRAYAIALAALPIKRFREITLEIDTFGGDVTLSFLTDLPGNAQTVRFTATVNTAAAGRRFVRVPLPNGTTSSNGPFPNGWIEGRLCRIQLSGSAKFVLYDAAVEVLAVGVYVEAYEAAGGAIYDTRELDLGTPGVKEVREIELDIETSGVVNVQLLSDISTAYTRTASTSGRQKVLLPLTVNKDTEQFVEGRLVRLILSGLNAFRLYGARLKARPFGEYLTAAEAAGGALWDSTDLDLGTQTVKQLRELELDIWAYGPYTVTVYTDLPGNAMASRLVQNQAATSTRTKVQIPLPQGGVPDNYLFGRLARVVITSAAAFKLFGARVHARPIGVYVESYEAAAGAVWDSLPQDLGNPFDKCFDAVRLEMDSDGACSLGVWTDLPGETMEDRGSLPLVTGATSRHWATVPLNPASNPLGYVEGRSIRALVYSLTGFRIYRAQVRAARVGRYLAAATPNGNDPFNSLEFDFGSERIRNFKRIEIDLRADGQVSLGVLTDQTGQMAVMYGKQISTPNGRTAIVLSLPPGLRGRLLRVSLTSAAAARIYRVRVWQRPTNETRAAWEWQDYPMEESEQLAQWADIPVPETPPAFAWSDLPVQPTPPEWAWAPLPVNLPEATWFWAKVLSVEETPDVWQWVDVPFEVSA